MSTVASWFSGAGGMDIGLERAGWQVDTASEIDPFASAVHASRWRNAPNLGCIRAVAGDLPPHDHDSKLRCVPLGGRYGDSWPVRSVRRADDGADALGAADLWAGGPPCQDLSVAGRRKGLAGERSGLALVWFDLVERYRPPAVLLENVPGLLSSHRGRDMATLTGRLAELGYHGAYRILDARFFGVPQRRRRVFLLALHARTGLGADGAAEVLAVGTRCGGHPAAGGEAGPGVADGVAVGALSTGLGHHGGAWGDQKVAAGHLVAHSLTASNGHHGHSSPRGDGSDNLIVNALAPVGGGPDDNDAQASHLIAYQGHGSNVGPMGTLRGGNGHLTGGVPFVKVTRPHGPDGDGERWAEQDTAPSMNGWDLRHEPNVSIATSSGVRRLTPVECERLQGWPDGWTIPDEWKGKRYDGSDLLPVGLDSHRYRAIGNGVAAPVAEWIGRRLLEAYEAESVA